jgi:hypothetical protein
MNGIFQHMLAKFVLKMQREYAKGFKGLETRTIDGTDFINSYNTVNEMLRNYS